MEKPKFEFLLNKTSFEEEILLKLNSSNPTKISEINFEATNFDFDAKNFELIISEKNKKPFSIPFNNKNLTLNKFIKFLNEMEMADEPLIFYIFDRGIEYLIYYSKINKISARFFVLSTRELYKKEQLGKILNYSYLEAEILLDVILNKNLLIKKLHLVAEEICKKFDNIAFFEQ